MSTYILDGKTPVPCDLETWARWFETADRQVAKDTIGDVDVSTVFLGLDHRNLHSKGPPLLFETMIFGGPHHDSMWRCSTWDEADRQHAEALVLVRSGLN